MSRRIPQLAGVVFAVVFVAALVIVPPFPGVDQPGTTVVTYAVEHASALRLQALLFTLGSLALVTVLGYARARLDGPAGYVFTIGSAVVLVEIALLLWFVSGLALHAHSLEPATARTVADVASMFGPILTVADVMVAVPIMLAARRGRFPRWLGVIAAIFALEQLVETVTIIGGAGTFIAPGGPMNLYVGGALFAVFFLALGLASGPDHSVGKNDSPSSGAPST